MFKYIALVLLVCSATAGHFQDSKTVLAELDQHRFGTTMLSAIQLNLQAKNPGEDILALIDEILAGVQQQDDDNEAENEIVTADCESTITNLKAQIAETTQAIADLEKAIAENEEILAQAKIDLAQAIEDYNETVNAIEVGTAERKAAHEKWANEDYEQTIQITTLDEGTKLINHMLHGVAFAQIESRYEKVVDKLKNSKGTHAGLFKPLVTSLTQLATKLNYENVQNILKLLGDIRASIVQQQTEAREAEEAAQAEWEHALKVLEAQKKALADKKVRLTNLIASTEEQLKGQRASLEQNKINLEDYNTSLNQKVEDCAKHAAEYEEVKAECAREIEILTKLKGFVEAKITALKEYLAARHAGAPGL